MFTQSIHCVASIELKNVIDNRKPGDCSYCVRRLFVTNRDGQLFELHLYSDEPEALKTSEEKEVA